MWVTMWVKTEGVRVEADGEDRLLDNFEGLLISSGEGEKILDILHGVRCCTDPCK
jgi:hypothetical protein